MKKTHLLIIFLSLFVLSNIVYPSSEVKFHFGIKGGYGFTSAIVGDHSSSSEGFFSKESLAGGIFVHFSHVDFAAIQFEALYIKKGFNRSGYKANLNTFSFPILARFTIPQVGIFFNAGFAITQIYDGEVIIDDVSYNNIDDFFDRLEYDLIGSIGWQLEVFEDGNVFIEYRLTYAINNISIRYPEELNHYSSHLYIGFEY